MATRKASVKAGGQVLSNLDPDMVITLDSHPGVRISSIQADSITYAFSEEVTEETLNTLNLTFVYKGYMRKVVPCNFKQNPVHPYVINVTPPQDNLKAAESNTIVFSLTDGDGAPITTATKVNLGITESPNNRFVIAGYSNTLTNLSSTTPGQYSLSINLGETKGKITISLTVAVPGKTDSYVLEDMVLNNPGSPVNISVNPTTVIANSSTTDVTLTLTRDKYLLPNAPAGGSVNVVNVTGPGSITVPAVVNEDGVYVIPVTSTDVVGKIVVTANYVPIRNGFNWEAIPFEFTIDSVVGPKLVIGTPTLDLNLWQAGAVNYEVTMAGENITSDCTLTIKEESIPGQLEYDISGSALSIKAISANPLEDVSVKVKVDVSVTHGESDYVLPMELDVTVLANTGGIPANRFNVEFL